MTISIKRTHILCGITWAFGLCLFVIVYTIYETNADEQRLYLYLMFYRYIFPILESLSLMLCAITYVYIFERLRHARKTILTIKSSSTARQRRQQTTRWHVFRSSNFLMVAMLGNYLHYKSQYCEVF